MSCLLWYFDDDQRPFLRGGDQGKLSAHFLGPALHVPKALAKVNGFDVLTLLAR